MEHQLLQGKDAALFYSTQSSLYVVFAATPVSGLNDYWANKLVGKQPASHGFQLGTKGTQQRTAPPAPPMMMMHYGPGDDDETTTLPFWRNIRLLPPLPRQMLISLGMEDSAIE